MGLILLLFTGITIGISGAMIPGPLTLFTVSEAVKSGRFAGLKIISGHIAVEFALILAILSGARRFIRSESFLSAISAIGGLALICMGVILISNVRKMKAPDKKDASSFNKGLFIGGAFFSIISPGFLVWWATIGISTALRALVSGIAGLIFLTLGHWLADAAWYWSISYAVDRGKSHLSGRAYQNILKFFSVLLITLGVRCLL